MSFLIIHLFLLTEFSKVAQAGFGLGLPLAWSLSKFWGYNHAPMYLVSKEY